MNKTDSEKVKGSAARKIISRNGMTMAEMLITVAIVIILMAVGFISLLQYQRLLAQIERDGYAKEMFIAAQNHLTMAKGTGYGLQYEDSNKDTVFGMTDTSAGDDVRYLVVEKGTINNKNINSPGGTGTMIDVMLPFGSIDETVRSGGSYIIVYQPKAGRIVQVFFVTRGDGKFDYKQPLKDTDYATFKGMAGDSKKSERRDYNGAVIGWYGGDDTYGVPEDIYTNPTIIVENGETLSVIVKNPAKNEGPETGTVIKLIITGKTSKGKMAVTLKKKGGVNDGRLTVNSGTYTYVLDDIKHVSNSTLHFSELPLQSNYEDNKTKLKPGEDLEIKAVIYNKDKFANICYSETVTENSLFESIKPDADGKKSTAYIGAIRHLENLEEKVSGRESGTGTDATVIDKVRQTKNLTWTGISVCDCKKKGGGDPKVYDGFRPVSTDNAIQYDGLRHRILRVKAVSDENGNAGIFGKTVSETEIKNLKLEDCRANGSANSGALVGELYHAKVSNVVAYNTGYIKNVVNNPTRSETVTGDNSGGLAGSMTGSSVLYCAAALVVDGDYNAGGLIGKVNSTDGNNAVKNVIRASYSGGHTEYGWYYDDREKKDDPIYNVTSSGGNAGGLLGDAGNALIRYCYSTCSASGDANGSDGGFAGRSSGAKIQDSYATGLVYGENAFVGAGTIAAASRNNYYYYIVNEVDAEDKKSTSYKEPGVASVEAFDESADTFNTFTGGTWNNAKPYDDTLVTYYDKKYSLRTVTQLMAGSTARIPNTSNGRSAYFVNTHYGDWPAPEIFIINN